MTGDVTGDGAAPGPRGSSVPRAPHAVL